MPRNKLQAALKNNGGAIANVTPRYEKLTDEQMRLAAFEARDNQEGAITDKMANSNRRNTLLAEMGFDWFDIDNLKPNPNNSYTITDEDVDLADDTTGMGPGEMDLFGTGAPPETPAQPMPEPATDAKGDPGQWITLENGTHVPVGKNGTIQGKGGLSGQKYDPGKGARRTATDPKGHTVTKSYDPDDYENVSAGFKGNTKETPTGGITTKTKLDEHQRRHQNGYKAFYFIPHCLILLFHLEAALPMLPERSKRICGQTVRRLKKKISEKRARHSCAGCSVGSVFQPKISALTRQ